MTKGEVSIFEPVGTDREGNQISLLDVLEYNDRNVAELLTCADQIKKIRREMGRVLDGREYRIIVERYGLDGREELTQREIASKLGISRSYVSRIEKRALLKLRKIIEKNDAKR